MRRRNAGAALAGLLLLSGCHDPAEAADRAAMLRELRDLRRELQAAPPAARNQPDRGQLTEALLPLRQLLENLVAEQAGLRERQAALAAELGRWSALAAAGANAGAKAEWSALQQRLAGLEQELQQQDSRHREVQELLRRALEGTADRLGEFLQRLEAPPAGAQPAAVPPAAPAGEPQPGRTGRGDGSWVREGYQPRRSGGEAETAVLLGLGTVMASFLVWRLVRQPRPGLAAAERGGDAQSPPWLDETEVLVRVLGSVHTAPAPACAAEEEPPDFDLSGLEPLAPLPSVEPRSPVVGWMQARTALCPDPDPSRLSAPAAPERVPGPTWLAVACDAAALPELERLAAADPRILRRPAPRPEGAGDGVRFCCAVLPDLPAGERLDLLARLRRRATGKHGSAGGASL